ncbi:MAG: hypothetical protein IPG59_00090 [Candidatus Melainabacteria bacterium]|nr:MAG: hypothetical protein IPG59_00090 [Candidatus Melainabacteria bacterium]
MKLANFLFLIGIAIASTTPVKAQEFVIPGRTITKTTTTRTFSDPNLPSAVKARMQDGIRYTVSTTQANGWEKGLVKGTPNLKNYFWCAMPRTNQAWSSSKTKTQTTTIPPQVRKFRYNKPVQVKTFNPNIKMPPPPEAPRQVASRSESHAEEKLRLYLNIRRPICQKLIKPTQLTIFRAIQT